MDMEVCTNDLLFVLVFYYGLIVILVAILKTMALQFVP